MYSLMIAIAILVTLAVAIPFGALLGLSVMLFPACGFLYFLFDEEPEQKATRRRITSRHAA